MFDKIFKKLYFVRSQLLIDKGVRNGMILPFEDDLYERLSRVYFNGYPLSLQIKYLRPTTSPGQCEDRSLFITMAFDDALWVSGDCKDLELKYGEKDACHFWVEYDGWVYDPSLLYKFKKELYYQIYMPTNVIVRNSDVYKKHEWYQDIVNTTLDDLRPGGKYRYRLNMSILLLKGIADMSDNQEFKTEVEEHLKNIDYDYEQIRMEMDAEINNLIRKRT